MKRQRFSVEQITAVLQRVAKGMPVDGMCRQIRISEQRTCRARARRRAASAWS